MRLRAEVERELNGHRSRMGKARSERAAREEELERGLTELERREQGVTDRETHVKALQEESWRRGNARSPSSSTSPG